MLHTFTVLQGRLRMKTQAFTKVITTCFLPLLLLMVSFLGCVRYIVNSTGTTIDGVYLRETGKTDWGSKQNQELRKTRVASRGSDGYIYITEKPVVDIYGKGVYDEVSLGNGDSTHFCCLGYDVGDVKLVGKNGDLYGKNNVNFKLNKKIVITGNDMYPKLFMHNNTGFPIKITSPITQTLDNAYRAEYQITELKKSRQHLVSYYIGNYRFENNVTLDTDVKIVFKERPPTVSVRNNTGYPITITYPFIETVTNGWVSKQYPKNSRNDNRFTFVYTSGTFVYSKEVVVGNEDVITTLTERDRPPIVTVQNNTGNTVNLVFLRNPGSNWSDRNVLDVKLRPEGTMDPNTVNLKADERIGSFTNTEAFKFWLGNIEIKPDKYDVRIDDVQGTPYVKKDVQILKDTTLTFTPKDKP